MAEAVEVYHRTYTTLLRSTGETPLRVLEASHRAMGSSLHSLAASSEPDLGAFLYAMRRLPASVMRAERVVMGQAIEVFARNDFQLIDWAEASAPGRRRRWYDDGKGTLAVLIASETDVDDLIPTLVAFQIEWNKLRTALGPAAIPTSPHPHGCRASAEAGRTTGRSSRRSGVQRSPSAYAWSPPERSRCGYACSAAPRSATPG